MHVVFSKTSMIWILPFYQSYYQSPFYQSYSKENIFWLNLRLFNVISHFLPNLFVTGIILDYLPLVSENPSPLPFLEKKTLLGGDYTPPPPPPSETLILKTFSAIYIYVITYNKSFTFTSCS